MFSEYTPLPLSFTPTVKSNFPSMCHSGQVWAVRRTKEGRYLIAHAHEGTMR
jgi:hypothetical protein